MRVTYYATEGIYQHADTQITPAKPGDQGGCFIRDPQDPSKWLCVHFIARGQNMVIGGFVELLVVAVEDKKIYLAQRHLSVVGNHLAPLPAPAAIVGSTAYFGGYYTNPAALAATPDSTEPPKYIARRSASYNGRQVDAMLIQNEQGSYLADLETGLLLSRDERFEGVPNQYHFAGQNPQGATSLRSAVLKGVRPIPWPWLGKPAPEWARNIKSITYRIEEYVTDPTATTPPVVTKRDAVWKVTARGADWVGFALVPPPGAPPAKPAADDAAGGVQLLASASVGPGSPFLPPAGLADLKLGQQIDSDPITRMTITVTTVERRGDSDIVGFTETAPGYTSRTIYDRLKGTMIFQQTDLPTATRTDTHKRITLTGAQ